MKRKVIFSILLITIFITQISSLMSTEAQRDFTNLELEENIQIPKIEIFTDSTRTFILHFQTKDYYCNFIETHTPKLEFPNLKMVVLEDWLSKKGNYLDIQGVDGVFDVTNSKMKISPPYENPDYKLITQDDGIKKTVTTKNILNLDPLWTSGYKGGNTRIMIVDSGIYSPHVDFFGRISSDSLSFINETFGYNENDPSIVDIDGHGTHTSGIAAGAGNGNPDYIGMAPEAEIVMARTIKGESGPTLASIAAYEYAIALGDIDVVSVSLGIPGDWEGFQASEIAVEELVRHGIVYVTSAGNEGPDYYTMGTPATAPNAIAVTFPPPPQGEYIWFMPSVGPTAEGWAKPDIAAPGHNIWSCGIESSTSYEMYSGTSMSCPHIGGASACLIDALKDLAIPYDHGLIKAALMRTADPEGRSNLVVGAGTANIGSALNHIQTAYASTTNGTGFPAILWAIPSIPINLFKVIPQGFHHEFYFQSVSSTPYQDLAPVVTGNITTIMTLNTTSWTDLWTKNYYATIDVPDDATLGVYDGLITFETAAGVNDTTYVKFTVAEGKAKLLMPKFYNDWSIDHILGQFIHPLIELLNQGIAVNEFGTWNITGEKNIITPELLDDYDAIFMSDIFDYSFDDSFQPYNTRYLHASENLAIQQFIEDGGGMFVVLNGLHDESGLITGNNITMVNELLNPYGIDISDELFVFEQPEKVAAFGYHPLLEGVYYIDHWGTTLSVTGDTQILFKYQGEGTAAAYENDNGGRVVAVTTNFFMDTFGYLENYNDFTQNAIFTMNVFDSLLAQEKIVVNYAEDTTGVTFNIKSIDTGATLSAELKKTTVSGTTTTPVTLTAGGSPGEYTYRLTYTDEAVYKFIVSSADDLYTNTFLYDKTPPVIDTGDWVNNTVPESARMEFAVTDALLPITSISVVLNGEFVSLAGTGKSRTFNVFTSELNDGDNILRIIAIDQAGNKVDATYVIPTKASKGPISTFAVLLGLLSLASIVTAIRRKRK